MATVVWLADVSKNHHDELIREYQERSEAAFASTTLRNFRQSLTISKYGVASMASTWAHVLQVRASLRLIESQSPTDRKETPSLVKRILYISDIKVYAAPTPAGP